jgi:hypothetical protein
MIIRRVMLALISLAIILAFYFLYTTLFTPQVAPEAIRPVQQYKLPTTRPVMKIPTGKITLMSPEDAAMTGEGSKPYFERYSKNRLLYQFRSDHWKPIGTGTGRFQLDKPELRLFLRGGQLLQVSATEGEIEADKSKNSRFDPKRGELRGKVHIFIDRGTDPKRTAPELRPQDIIHIWLDYVKFDLVRNVIESDSTLKIESDEVDLTGQALSIAWNEVSSQIEDITIKRGDKLILRQGFDMISPDMPFAKNSAKSRGAGKKIGFGPAEEVAEPSLSAQMMLARNPVSKSKLSLPGRNQDDTIATPSPTSKASRKKSTTQSTQPRLGKSYDLVFSSAVKIFQYDGPKMTGKMNCDRLHVIFDIPKGSENKSLTTRPTTREAKKVAKDKDNKRLEIFWEGPLQMKPKALPYSPLRRFHIVALGQPVQIDQMEQGSVRCKILTYFQETKQLWLDGTTDEPVNVSQGADRTIVAAHLFYDRKLGIASGTGAGFMQQSNSEKSSSQSPNAGLALPGLQGGGQKMMVLWKEGFQLNLGEFEKTDATGTSTRQYLKRAEFRGAARMQRPGETMAGDLVVLSFMQPMSAEKGSEKINTLHAERNVLLQSDQQKIICEQLDVEFGEGNFGRIPKIAKARGKVTAREKGRVIGADVLTARMEDKQVQVAAKNPNPQNPSSEKPKLKTRVVLREVDASGNVTIRDPSQPINVDAQKMHAILDPEGAIRWCYLEGTDKTWARADLKDYGIAGRQVTMDLTTEQIDVPGPGEVTLVNRGDFFGEENTSQRTSTARGNKISILWSDSMKMTGGKKNQGTFLGKAKVRSDRTTMYCDRLLVDFENLEPREKAPEKETKTKGWTISKLVGSSRAKESSVQMPISRKRPTYIQAFAEKGKSITVQYLTKEADRLLSRTTLWGETLTLDLAANRLNMPGPGKFFIEDYRLPDQGKGKGKMKKGVVSAGVPELKDPFGTDVQSNGPSQTAFTWQTGLTYLLDARTAIFDGLVRMVHVAGAQIPAQATGNLTIKDKSSLRQAILTCENLKVEFLRGGFGFAGENQSGASEIKSVLATGAVHLQDKPRSVIAQRLMYNRTDNMIAVYGTDLDPAYLYQEDEETGQYSMWKGPLIVWDRTKNEIRAPGAAITTTLR